MTRSVKMTMRYAVFLVNGFPYTMNITVAVSVSMISCRYACRVQYCLETEDGCQDAAGSYKNIAENTTPLQGALFETK